MIYEELENIVAELEQSQSQITFNVFVNSDRIYSYYENQFYITGPRPCIAYNAEDGLYYWTQGPQLTAAKRKYPIRYAEGSLAGPQPEFYYARMQQTKYTPIIARASDYEYQVILDGIKGWPKPPFYVYLCQRDSGGSGNQHWEPTYRYSEKLKVINVIEDHIFFETPLILEPDLTHPIILAYFDRNIDAFINATPIQIMGDETSKSISIKETTPILVTYNPSTFIMSVTDIYKYENGTFTFIESSMADPSVTTEIYILLRADSGTIIKSNRTRIKSVIPSGSVENYTYAVIDPSNPFLNINFDAIDDPFEDLSKPENITPGTEDPIQPSRQITGKTVTRYFRISILPHIPTLSADNIFAYFEEIDTTSLAIPDEELSVELFGNMWSLRPHSAITPLEAPAYADIYDNNWVAPWPYPIDTCIKDADESTINGFKCDTFPRMDYRRDRNSWYINGTVMVCCDNFQDASFVEDCILSYQDNKYIKLRNIEDNIHLYHIAGGTWI